MNALTTDQADRVQLAIEGYIFFLSQSGISLRVRHNFESYAAIRRTYGDFHLNQAFDPRETRFGEDDFWLLAENHNGEAMATYCVRRFLVRDFYILIKSQKLWFSKSPRRVDQPFIGECAIPPFGGDVIHGGGLWVRPDLRGCSRLALVMPRFARAIALRIRPFDHDSGMILSDPRDRMEVAERKAAFMGKRVYGFVRVHRLVHGWFPPEGRHSIVHLCHSTRAEAVDSLRLALMPDRLQRLELRKRPLVYQHDELVDPPAVRSKRQQQASV